MDPKALNRILEMNRDYWESMREFAHTDIIGGFECPVCHTWRDLPVVLVSIPGTEDDGNVECEQVHSECYKLLCRMNEVDVEIEE